MLGASKFQLVSKNADREFSQSLGRPFFAGHFMGYLRLINDFDDLCRRLGANKAFTETSIDISRECFLYLDFLLQGDIPNSRVDAREHRFFMRYRLL